MEAFNGALRRNVAAYRRRTNTYAKSKRALQTRLDAYWVYYNFIRPHDTTHIVPAVALGILSQPLSWANLFRIRYLAS